AYPLRHSNLGLTNQRISCRASSIIGLGWRRIFKVQSAAITNYEGRLRRLSHKTMRTLIIKEEVNLASSRSSIAADQMKRHFMAGLRCDQRIGLTRLGSKGFEEDQPGLRLGMF